MKIIHVVGARPNFMKIAPIMEAISKHNEICKQSERINQFLVHTGQHYDERMSKLFFSELGIPKPDINLEVGSSSHAEQTAEIMKRFEPVCLTEKPTHVLVVGDVNSTIACALVAAKLGIKVIHVEAGLRSFDRTMPEEINRVLTDSISDLLFTTEESANENLMREGIPEEKVYFVGNVMIDTLIKHRERAAQSDILNRLGLAVVPLGGATSPTDGKAAKNPISPYAVLTLHRPSNVDSETIFRNIIEALKTVACELPIVFPIHPRTVSRIRDFALEAFFEWSPLYQMGSNATGGGTGAGVTSKTGKGIHVVPPLGYLDFLHLISNARLVFTDSGGIQEESTILNVPCITMRENTERPVTVSSGTNMIAGTTGEKILNLAFSSMKDFDSVPASEASTGKAKHNAPPLWDGQSADRIVRILVQQSNDEN